MSSAETEGEDARPRREVAHRVFAAEFDDATLSYSESDEERAPNYVVTPTGARVNRLFVAGVLTELEELGNGQLRARIADPTGVFVVYAGQYQPEALAALERLDAPAFIALTGKARTFQPEDSNRVFTSIRPESISEIDAATRDRWIVETSARTLDRIGAFAALLADGGVGSEAVGAIENRAQDEADGPESGIALAREHYGTSPAYLEAMQELALDAARLIAGDIEELRALDIAPDEAGETDLDSLAASDIEGETVAALANDEGGTPTSGSEPEETSGTGGTATVDEEENAVAIESAESSEPTPTAEPSNETTALDTELEDTSESEATDTEDVAQSLGGVTALSDDEPDAVASSEEESDFGSEAAFDDSDTTDNGEDIEEFEGEFDLSEEEREEIEAEYGTDFATGSEVDEPGEADIEPTAPAVEESDEDRPEEETADDTAATGDAGGEPIDGSEPTLDSTADPTTESEPDVEPESEPEPNSETETEPEPEAEPATDADTTESEDEGDSEDEPGVESVGEPGSTTETEGFEEAEAGIDPEAASDEPSSDEQPEPVAEESETTATGGDTGAEPADVDVTEAVMDAMRELDDGDGADRGTVIERVGEEYGISEAAADEAIQDALLGGQCYEPGENRLKAI
ncbi:hypothetical protein BRC86_03640 [Halobacteriales archaeon QS_3_64_16]|nr:MAG: hypothetical protein BRC86_03640 [Halobacteriales archaeon QS_3_64_16]